LLGCTVPARGGGFECETFSDQALFEALNGKSRRVLSTFEAFDPASNVGFGDLALLTEPLQGGVPNVDPENGLGFPGGLVADSFSIEASAEKLAGVGPGFLDPLSVVPPTVAVGANLFAESTDIVLLPGANFQSIGFTVEVAFGGDTLVTVFDTSGLELVQEMISVAHGERAFFGIICYDVAIGRVNIGGPGGELVDDIQTWAETCPWDCGNTDGKVGAADMVALVNQWGTPGPCDFNGDGAVTTIDLLTLIANWGICPDE
jgi:hypothetical protein